MLTFFKHGLASERLYYTLDGGERQSLSWAALGRFFRNFLIFGPTDPCFEAGRRRTGPGGPIRRPRRRALLQGRASPLRCVHRVSLQYPKQSDRGKPLPYRVSSSSGTISQRPNWQAPALQGLIFHRDVIPSNRQTDEAPALRCPPLSRTWRTDPSGLSQSNHPTKLRFAGTPGFQNSRAK